MERNIQAQLTLPKHPKLLHEINEMSICIKAWHFDLVSATPESVDKLRHNHRNPTWHEVESLLRRCYNAINEQREDPRKY